nr:DUF2868 domain-containing protein [Azomonas macrocytogenes]
MNAFDRLWLTEAVRLREEHAGPLEDDEANRQARATGGDFSTLIEHRALWLARRDGLLEALRHWHQGARLAGILLIVLAVFSGAGLAATALGDSQRPVNVFWALGSLLGLNLLTLLTWFGSSRFSRDSGGALGRLWLWLSEKFARDAHAVQLVPALLVVLQENRLTRWLLGSAVHGLWSVAMTSTLVTMLAMLATHRYGFVWETTILNDNTFIGLTHMLGLLPGLLGFDLPTIEQIRASGAVHADLESARQAWASWMVGVLLAYGLLPRLVLAGLCYWRWRRGRTALRLDLQRPAFRLLRNRLQPAERLGISDPAPASLPTQEYAVRSSAGTGALLVAIELDSTYPWPPQLPTGVGDAGILDDRQQRRELLEQLTRNPPARLAIACDPRRSADRGTLALIGELSRCAVETRVWLLPAPPGEQLDGDRLSDWREALNRMGIVHTDSNLSTWLESGHD